MKNTCRICGELHYAKGLCRKHYIKERYTQNPKIRKAIVEKGKKNWKKYYDTMVKKDSKWNAERQKRWRTKNPESYKKSMAKSYLRMLGKKDREKLLGEMK